MQLFRARKLLHSALTGHESGERGVRRGGLRIRRSKGISSKYLRASINILHKRIPLPSPLYLSGSYFAKLFANSFPRKIVQQLGMNPVPYEVEVSKLENVYLFLGLIKLVDLNVRNKYLILFLAIQLFGRNYNDASLIKFRFRRVASID